MSDFIRIPSDGIGKRIRHSNRQDLSITTSLVDLNNIDLGDTITSSGGATGKFTGWRSVTIEGGIDISVGEVTGEFSSGDTISHPTLGTIGTLTETAVPIYTPSVNLADADSPYNTQKVDRNGNAYVRYEDGELLFDAFGAAQFSQNVIVDVHSFTYGDVSTRYYDQTRTSGEVSASIQDASLVFKTNSTSGSFVQRTTNQYYPYTPGEGTEFLFSARAGDTGKAGLIRRMGAFDDYNGIFLELSGSTLSAVLRSNASGVVVEDKVEQSDFNGDELLSTDTNEFVLDFTKYNLFWMDFQWLGVGKIRIGTYSPVGKRVVMHTFQNPNSKIYPWARSGTLPIRIEQFNETATASSSEMRIVCMAIIKQSNETLFKGETFTTVVENVAVSGSFVPIATARPKTTFNGVPNRITVIPLNIETIVDGDPVRIDIIANANLTGSTFTANANPFSATEVDSAATSYTGGSRFETIFSPVGAFDRELDENLDNTLNLSADGNTQPTLTFAAKTVKSGGTADVTFLVRWREVK